MLVLTWRKKTFLTLSVLLSVCFLWQGTTFAREQPNPAGSGPQRRKQIESAQLRSLLQSGKVIKNVRLDAKDLINLLHDRRLAQIKVSLKSCTVLGTLNFHDIGQADLSQAKDAINPKEVDHTTDSSAADRPPQKARFIVRQAIHIIDSEVIPLIDESDSPPARGTAAGAVSAAHTRFSRPVDFTGTAFAGAIDFSHAIFDDQVTFSAAIFSNQVDFKNARFHQKADFSFINAGGEIYFDNALFYGQANFKSAKFGKDANFTFVEFFGELDVDKATFYKDSTFIRASFYGKSTFRRTDFRGRLYFQHTIFEPQKTGEETDSKLTDNDSPTLFEPKFTLADSVIAGEATFEKTKFGVEVDFGNVVFKESVSFFQAHFDQRVTFGGSTFEGNASFQEVFFQDKSIFDRSLFGGEAMYGRAEFIGNTQFIECIFQDEADFSEVFYRADANFKYSIMGGKCSFRSAQFRGVAYFTATIFTDTATFANAVFEKNVYFTTANFNKLATFKNTTFFSDVKMKCTIFIRYADFRDSTILDFLDFNNEICPTIIAGRIDFRNTAISRAEFRDITFLSDVDFSGAQFGQDLLNHTSTSIKDSQVAPPQTEMIDQTCVSFQSVRFSGDVFFDETDFGAFSAFKNVKFDKDAFFTNAKFTRDLSPALEIEKVDISNIRIRWRQLPDPHYWLFESRNLPTEKKRSQLFHNFERNFRRNNNLSDANKAYYHGRLAELYESRALLDWSWNRFVSELEWFTWGLPTGYGTKIDRVVFFSGVILILFALIYFFNGNFFQVKDSADKKGARLRILIHVLPENYLVSADDMDGSPDRIKPLEKNPLKHAAILSMTLLLKIGYKNIKIAATSGEKMLRVFVTVEWLIGFYIIFALAYTLKNTIPLLSAAMTMFAL